jgi:hypothetical protein
VRRTVQLLGLIVLLALPACVPVKPKPPVVPQIVQVPVTKYVPVPAELTAACPKAKPEKRTVAEAVRVAKARGDALDQCNAQLDAIRKLGQ